MFITRGIALIAVLGLVFAALLILGMVGAEGGVPAYWR